MISQRAFLIGDNENVLTDKQRLELGESVASLCQEMGGKVLDEMSSIEHHDIHFLLLKMGFPSDAVARQAAQLAIDAWWEYLLVSDPNAHELARFHVPESLSADEKKNIREFIKTFCIEMGGEVNELGSHSYNRLLKATFITDTYQFCDLSDLKKACTGVRKKFSSERQVAIVRENCKPASTNIPKRAFLIANDLGFDPSKLNFEELAGDIASREKQATEVKDAIAALCTSAGGKIISVHRMEADDIDDEGKEVNVFGFSVLVAEFPSEGVARRAAKSVRESFGMYGVSIRRPKTQKA